MDRGRERWTNGQMDRLVYVSHSIDSMIVTGKQIHICSTVNTISPRDKRPKESKFIDLIKTGR